jgi:hypothetical protein
MIQDESEPQDNPTEESTDSGSDVDTQALRTMVDDMSIAELSQLRDMIEAKLSADKPDPKDLDLESLRQENADL